MFLKFQQQIHFQRLISKTMDIILKRFYFVSVPTLDPSFTHKLQEGSFIMGEEAQGCGSSAGIVSIKHTYIYVYI